MPDDDGYIVLPSDPADLTRELALACCSHPEVLYDIFARLAASSSAHQPSTQPAPMPEGAASGR